MGVQSRAWILGQHLTWKKKPPSGIWKRNKATREKHKEVLKFQIKIPDNIDKNLPFLNRNSDAEKKNFQYKL